MKKWIWTLLAVALLAGGGFWYYTATKAKTEKAPDPTGKVEKGSLAQMVSSDGKVVSNLDVDIKCKASGEIIRLPYDVSDLVRKGSLLVELDPKDEKRNVAQAEASLASARAKLQSARDNLALKEANLATDRKRYETNLISARARAADAHAKAVRSRDLMKRKIASREETETAETAAITAENDMKEAELKKEDLVAQEQALAVTRQEILAAQAQEEITKVALEIARQRLDDTRVYAPIDGVVTTRNVQVGQIISSPISNVGGGTTILTLSDLSGMYVLATVDEADIGQVSLGQQVKVTVDSFPGRSFAGKVVRISPRGVNTSNVVTFETKIEITSPDKNLLRPEMTSHTEIEIARRENVLTAPSDALFRKDGRQHVTVVKADLTQEDVPVRTGISDGRRTEIVEGLSEGDQVVIRKTAADAKFTGRSGRPYMGMR